MANVQQVSSLSFHEQYHPIAAVKKGLSDVSCETGLMIPIGIALLIIAGLTLGGVMGGSTAAWSMIGLSIPLVIGGVIRILRARPGAERISALVQTIMFSVALTMGSLALTNIEPMMTASITILSVLMTTVILQSIVARCCKEEKKVFNDRGYESVSQNMGNNRGRGFVTEVNESFS